jgi:hypothetical protein
MGDSQNDPIRVGFLLQNQARVRRFDRHSDAGFLAYRELDEALGLTSKVASGLLGSRTGQNTQHGLLVLLRQSLYSGLADYEDVNDAERLCLHPLLRVVVCGRVKDQTAASTSEMVRSETETLSTKENLQHLMDLSGQRVDLAHRHRKLTKLILDLDSCVSETYGYQEGSAYVLSRLMELIAPMFEPTTLAAFRRTALEGSTPAQVAEELGLLLNAVLVAKSRVLSTLRQEAKDLID